MSSSRKQFSVERRPRMLKDFLIDNESNSCSSSGFESLPRRRSSIRSLIQNDVNDVANNNKASLLRSRSKAAASTTISAFLAIINTVKAIQLNNVVKVKPPSILPRISLSRKLSSKKKSTTTTTKEEIINNDHIKITVRVKDIIRWKSFRDLVLEEKPQLPDQPSDLASSPDHQCTTTTTTIASSTTNSTPSPCSSSNGSSWCESDFTSEYYYLPPLTGNSAENDAHGHVGEKYYLPRVGSDCDSMKTTIESAVGPKELHGEEKEQLSPVSVLDFELQEDEDHSVSSFDQTLANLEKWMSLEENDGDDSSAEEEEEINNIEVEEEAKLLLNQIKTTISPTWNCKDGTIVSEQLLLDFLVDELSAKRNNQSRINEIVRQAEAWIKGEDSATTLLIDDAGECVRDMDRKESWNRFECEQEEVSLQIENTLLNLLVDDLLLDL